MQSLVVLHSANSESSWIEAYCCWTASGTGREPPRDCEDRLRCGARIPAPSFQDMMPPWYSGQKMQCRRSNGLEKAARGHWSEHLRQMCGESLVDEGHGDTSRYEDELLVMTACT